MRPGTYLDKDGNTVTVKQTPSGGYVITHADGHTTVIGGR
jgi:hypothetical protein